MTIARASDSNTWGGLNGRHTTRASWQSICVTEPKRPRIGMMEFCNVWLLSCVQHERPQTHAEYKSVWSAGAPQPHKIKCLDVYFPCPPQYANAICACRRT